MLLVYFRIIFWTFVGPISGGALLGQFPGEFGVVIFEKAIRDHLEPYWGHSWLFWGYWGA
jgi:hypothetical protein